jgi:hypothetical protein
LIAIKFFQKVNRSICIKKTMTKTDWLKRTKSMLGEAIETAESLMTVELSTLNTRINADSWSILQCIEHLNLYNRYYLTELQKARGAAQCNEVTISYSWVGKKSISMMDPSNTKKQKTFKHMQPAQTSFSIDVLEKFLATQATFQEIIHDAGEGRYALNKKSIRVEFFKLLKMYRGETLEFLHIHQLRHLQQAQQIRNRLIINPALIV